MEESGRAPPDTPRYHPGEPKNVLGQGPSLAKSVIRKDVPPGFKL